MILRTAVLLLAFAALPFAQSSALPAQQDNPLAKDTLWPPTLETYLPKDQAYDASFPEPSSVLGWPVGTWHVRHDQLVRWFEVVAERSPRVTLMRTGETHEQRPLLLATITSPANHARIDEIREAHVKAVRSGAVEHDGPTVIWMGYGVHGNESSASNASLLLLYHLAAATGPEFDAFLERTVILIDPCINPDGGARFAHWANMHRGENLVGDPSSREHNEAWPGGRTNHYWFDLNRDWLLLTHPESRARVAQFQRWLPVVLTDYHEMGSGSTYFFQPGIPSRRNPLTPERNPELTAEIAKFHAAALDEIGSLYFTEESYDDFYYGKGSTYPDIQGAIGILFEQASARGHLMDTQHGELSFPFTIRNQFTTSLTTLLATDTLREELTTYQRQFFRDAAKEAAESEIAGYVFGDIDRERTDEMVRRLQMHGIEVHGLAQDYRGFKASGRERTRSFVVPLDQPQSRLIRALFETRTSWDDNTFYDVSSWTFPLSFDVPCVALRRPDWSEALICPIVHSPGAIAPLTDDPTGFTFAWTASNAAAALHALQLRGIRASVATEESVARSRSLFAGDVVGFFDAPHTIEPGAIVVMMSPQDVSREEISEALGSLWTQGLQVKSLLSGLTPEGPDLGSGSFSILKTPKPLLLIGAGVSSYEAGEVWHELDTRIGMAVTKVDRARFDRLDLKAYTHVILVSGATSGWGDDEKDKLRTWVRSGGHVIATKRSALWVAKNLMKNQPEEHDGHDGEDDDEDDDSEDESDDATDEPLKYADYRAMRSEQRVAGTIFEATIDRTHPLGFGFTRDTLPVFRNYEGILPEALDPFATPLRYTEEPLLSGFASEANIEKIAGSPALRAERIGRGTVIVMVDDPVFRGVWYGTRRLLINAIFFAGAIRSTRPIEGRTDEEEATYEHGHEHGH